MAKDIVVIGGGPAGVEAALTAAPHAKSVSVVADSPVGDWNKLMPSRVWCTALEQIRSISRPPLEPNRQSLKNDIFDLSSIATHVNRVAARWNGYIAKELQVKGVKTIAGRASFVAPNQVLVRKDDNSTETLGADATIIASGAVPFFPPGLEPDSRRVFSPNTLEQLKSLPQSILLVGDSIIGYEFVDLFSQLGVEVIWLVLEGGPITGLDPELDGFLLNIFKQRGVRIEAGPPIGLQRGKEIVATRADGTRFAAETAFISIGQRPNLAPLNLAAAGLRTDQDGLVVTDEWGQTNIAGIYVVGNALRFGPGNFALAQARVAALHATGENVTPFDRDSTIICFGLNPQAAQVGTLPQADNSLHSSWISYEANISTHINDDVPGFLRIAWNKAGRVVGGLAVGRNATEALAPVAMSIRLKASIGDLANMQGPHPTIGELPFMAARQRT